MEKRVYYHDTDAGGVVYYGNYLKFLEESRTEHLEKKGLSVKAFHEQGIFYAVRKCSIDYKSPAKYGDILICQAQVIKVTAAQIIFQQTILQKKSARVVVEALVNLVCLNSQFKPIAMPDHIKDSLTS